MYAEIDYDIIVLNKSFVDLIGNYSRPDLFTLDVDGREKTHVLYHHDGRKSMKREKVGGIVKKVERDDRLHLSASVYKYV